MAEDKKSINYSEQIKLVMLNTLSTISFDWLTVTKAEIEIADGRKNKNESICKQGSCLYVAKGKNGEIIYIGETSKSIKRRFISDGDGSHSKKSWYNEIEEVCYLRYENEILPTNKRKMLEQALSIILNPKYYGRNA